MKELTILDFALGIALLYHWGADGKEIRNFAKRVRSRVELEYRPLVDLCIEAKELSRIRATVLAQLLTNVATIQQAAFGRFFFRLSLATVEVLSYSSNTLTNNRKESRNAKA